MVSTRIRRLQYSWRNCTFLMAIEQFKLVNSQRDLSTVIFIEVQRGLEEPCISFRKLHITKTWIDLGKLRGQWALLLLFAAPFLTQ